VKACSFSSGLTTLDGQSANLSTFLAEKKPVVIELWATWCPLCRELEPATAAAQKKCDGRVILMSVGVPQTRRPRTARLREGTQPRRRVRLRSRCERDCRLQGEPHVIPRRRRCSGKGRVYWLRRRSVDRERDRQGISHARDGNQVELVLSNARTRTSTVSGQAFPLPVGQCPLRTRERDAKAAVFSGLRLGLLEARRQCVIGGVSVH
jgi:hypothetical protein